MPLQKKHIPPIGITLLLVLSVGCAKKTPTAKSIPPAPSATMATPNWGQSGKTTGCTVNGSLQDRDCTPGDIIAANTQAVICAAAFRTGTVRDSVTSPDQKKHVYAMYGIPAPSNNRGKNQKCEIDHLVSLELGGNDTMANLWPQCSPGYAGWTGASFRDKDKFENYLHRQVCAGKIPLDEAQRQIATDWYKFWVAAGQPKK